MSHALPDQDAIAAPQVELEPFKSMLLWTAVVYGMLSLQRVVAVGASVADFPSGQGFNPGRWFCCVINLHEKKHVDVSHCSRPDRIDICCQHQHTVCFLSMALLPACSFFGAAPME